MGFGSVLKTIFSKPYATVSAAQAAALAEGGGVLLDVREPQEWQAGHAPRARHIPLSQLPRRARHGQVGRNRGMSGRCCRDLYAAVRWKVVPTLFWMKAPGRRRAISCVAFQPVQ